MISKQNTKSSTTPKNLITIALSAVFFIAAYSGQSGQAQAQVENITFTDVVIETETEATGWVQSFEDAVAQSKSSGKPMMLVFSGSDWCSYCQLLEQEVFRTQEFESWSNDNVIKVMVDFPQYSSQSTEVAIQNQNLKRYFAGHLKGYPTVLIVEPTGSVIGRSGYVAGGPLAWITKADSILRQPAHHLAVTNSQNR